MHRSGHGGRRPGSGRPTSEPTQVIRVPVSRLPAVRAVIQKKASPIPALLASLAADILTPATHPMARRCPLYQSRITAGFPSPADDYVEGQLDLNQYLIDRPAATFFVRVQGDSMIDVGIHPGDLLIVDRSRSAEDGKVIIAVLDGELTVKRLRYQAGQLWLYPENDSYPPLRITEERDFHIWGVVRHVIHSL